MRMFTLILCFLFSFSCDLGASPIMVDRIEGPLPIISFLSWLDDTSDNIGIAKASSLETQNSFSQLGNGFPPIAKGSGWLRLELAKTPPETGLLPKLDGEGLFFKVGLLPSGTTTIYYQDNLDPLKTPGVWFATELKSNEGRLLPEPPLSGATVFVHFEETPGLWFAPLLEKGESPLLLPPDSLLPGILLCGIIVCLLRALKEKTLWPVWASLLLALGIVQVTLPLPLLTRSLIFKDLPAMMAPGLSIMIFPHLARLLLRTKDILPSLHVLLKGVTICGAILSLVPLFSQFNWITRLYPLWPLFLIPLLPFCLSALGRRKHGALVFTGLCLLPVIGAGWALGSLFMPEIHPLAEHGGIWGLAISGLFLFLARVPKEETSAKTDSAEKAMMTEAFPELPFEISPFSDQEEQDLPQTEEENIELENDPRGSKSTPSSEKRSERVEQEMHIPDAEEEKKEKEEEKPITFVETTHMHDEPHRDEGKPLATSSRPSPADSSSSSLYNANLKSIGMSSLFNETPEDPSPKDLLGSKEETQESKIFSAQNKNDLSEVNSPSEISVLPNLEEDAEKLPPMDAPLFQSSQDSMDETSPTPVRFISLEHEEFSDTEWERQASAIRASMPIGESYLFDLQSLVRDIHNAAMPLAEDKDILLSWFISPSLPSILEGDAASLRQALSLLIQNAVQATHKGAVQLFVRHDPASPQSELASLQFTISDTGVAQRAEAGFFHAWELAQRTGGNFSIEYSVSGGTLIMFSVKFILPSDEVLQTQVLKEPSSQSEIMALHKQPSHSEAFPLTQQILKSIDIRSPEAILESTEDMPIETDMDPSLPKFIITDMTTSNKRLLSHYLSTIPHTTIESKSIAHAMELVQRINPALIIYDADSPEDIILTSVRTIVERRKQQGLPPLPQLVITGHDEQAKRMIEGGAMEVLLKPFSQESLQTVLFKLLPLALGNIQNSQLTNDQCSLMAERDRTIQTATKHTFEQKKETADSFTQPDLQNEDNLQKILSESNNSSVTQQHAVHEIFTPTINVPEDTLTDIPVHAMSSLEIDNIQDRLAAPLLQNLSHDDIMPATSKKEKENPSPLAGIESVALSNNSTKSAEENITANTNQGYSYPRPLAKEKGPLEEASVPSHIVDQEQGGNYSLGDTTTESSATIEESGKNTFPPAIEPQQLSTLESDIIADTADHHLDESLPNEPTSDSPPAVSRLEEAGKILFEPAPTGSLALPGIENESIEIVMLPLLPGLINTLEDALADSMKARQEHQTIFVQEAVSRLSGKAEVFGLTRLGKIGRCVERAAEADDFEAVDTLLDDLISVTSRYIGSLKECYNSFVSNKR